MQFASGLFGIMVAVGSRELLILCCFALLFIVVLALLVMNFFLKNRGNAEYNTMQESPGTFEVVVANKEEE